LGKKISLVAGLNAIPDAPWWSAALDHTIAWCMPTPQLSVQVSSPHHGAMPLTLGFGEILLGGE